MSPRKRSVYYQEWRPYVRVADRKRNAARLVKKLRAQGRAISPIEIDGRKIARTFWGTAWCDNLEHYSDYENRLPRGRSYARNGSVIDLRIESGKVAAMVSGNEIYDVEIKIRKLPKKRWGAIVADCVGRIDSLVDLLAGELSDGVMEVLSRPEVGLFPAPSEIALHCSCPDWADMCKHVAAALYGVGARLDRAPELLFVLRRVDATDLIAEAGDSTALTRLTDGGAGGDVLDGADLSDIFGIELDAGAGPSPAAAKAKPPDRHPRRKRGRRRKTITSRELLDRGVPRTTFKHWLASGVLLRTDRRGVYRTTASTEARIERALQRRREGG